MPYRVAPPLARNSLLVCVGGGGGGGGSTCVCVCVCVWGAHVSVCGGWILQGRLP